MRRTIAWLYSTRYLVRYTSYLNGSVRVVQYMYMYLISYWVLHAESHASPPHTHPPLQPARCPPVLLLRLLLILKPTHVYAELQNPAKTKEIALVHPVHTHNSTSSLLLDPENSALLLEGVSIPYTCGEGAGSRFDGCGQILRPAPL